jgi:hypothetical protein
MHLINKDKDDIFKKQVLNLDAVVSREVAKGMDCFS